MSDTNASTGGPQFVRTVDEVRGTFANSEQLQTAITELMNAGFDRADLSIPVTGGLVDHHTPEMGAANPNTADDAQQARTLFTSLAGSVGAMAAAGVVIATGGAALPAVAAALAGGAGAGLAANAASGASNANEQASRDDAAVAGTLTLTVRTTDAARKASAERILNELGASDVHGDLAGRKSASPS
jgi:hypothetical protein